MIWRFFDKSFFEIGDFSCFWIENTFGDFLDEEKEFFKFL